MDLNTFLMRKQAGAWDYHSVVPVKQNNGWVYDSVTKSAIPAQYYFNNTGSYDDDHSVSLYDEDEFNQFASKYDGNTFDFQAYNSSGRDLGRYNARKENLDDAARREAEVKAYEDSAQWREYQEVMKRNNAANTNTQQTGASVTAPGVTVDRAGAILQSTYNSGAPTTTATTETPAPGSTATPGVTPAPGSTPPTTGKKTVTQPKKPTGVGSTVGNTTTTAPKDPGGHISRDQALMLLHKGYSPTSIGGWTQAYDNNLTGEHLAKMKADPNYNPFSHYNKSQADRIINKSTTPEIMNFNNKKYDLKDPLQAREYQAARAKHKASLDPNSAEYKRLYPSNNKRLIPAQIAKQNRYAANYGYIPGHLFN